MSTEVIKLENTKIEDVIKVNPQEYLNKLHASVDEGIGKLRSIDVISNSSDFDGLKSEIQKAERLKKVVNEERMVVTRWLDQVKKHFMAPEKKIDELVNEKKNLLGEYFSKIIEDADVEVDLPESSVRWVDLIAYVYQFERSMIDWIPESLVDSIKSSVKSGKLTISLMEGMRVKIGGLFSNLSSKFNDLPKKHFTQLNKSNFSEKSLVERMGTYVSKTVYEVIGNADEQKQLIEALSGLNDDSCIRYYVAIRENTNTFLKQSGFNDELDEILGSETINEDKEIIDNYFDTLVSQKAGLILTNSVKEIYIPTVRNKDGLLNAINWYLDNNKEGFQKLTSALSFIFDEIRETQSQVDGVKFRREQKLKF